MSCRYECNSLLEYQSSQIATGDRFCLAEGTPREPIP